MPRDKKANYIRAALKDPVMRTQVIVLGALSTLPSDRARKRVLEFVIDYFDENPEKRPSPKRRAGNERPQTSGGRNRAAARRP
jgi:hypothetical protein